MTVEESIAILEKGAGGTSSRLVTRFCADRRRPARAVRGRLRVGPSGARGAITRRYFRTDLGVILDEERPRAGNGRGAPAWPASTPRSRPLDSGGPFYTCLHDEELRRHPVVVNTHELSRRPSAQPGWKNTGPVRRGASYRTETDAWVRSRYTMAGRSGFPADSPHGAGEEGTCRLRPAPAVFRAHPSMQTRPSALRIHPSHGSPASGGAC
jgi:hypothetical protein